jgi:hypothetical protein
MLARRKIVAATVVLIAAIAVAVVATLGPTESAVRTLVRATARVSTSLFLLAFAASSVRAMWPSAFTAWLVANRRYLGLAFAAAHFAHLAALLVLARYFPHPFLDEQPTVAIVGGGLAYVFITLMTITSFAPPRHAIGERAWRILHLTGGWYVWLIFLLAYAGRATSSLGHAALTAALLFVLILRISHWLKRRNAPARTAA